ASGNLSGTIALPLSHISYIGIPTRGEAPRLSILWTNNIESSELQCRRFSRLRKVGPVAQLDRALRFERRGWEFKSLRFHHCSPLLSASQLFSSFVKILKREPQTQHATFRCHHRRRTEPQPHPLR